MSDDENVQPGDLVTYSVTSGSETFTAHGRWSGTRRQAVTREANRYFYTQSEREAIDEGRADAVADWAIITSATGGEMELPRGSRSFWSGAATNDGIVPVMTEDWLMNGATAQLKRTSTAVRIERITDEGRAWVERYLSVDKLRERFETRLQAAAPELMEELARLLTDTYQEGVRAEALRNGEY